MNNAATTTNIEYHETLTAIYEKRDSRINCKVEYFAPDYYGENDGKWCLACVGTADETTVSGIVDGLKKDGYEVRIIPRYLTTTAVTPLVTAGAL